MTDGKFVVPDPWPSNYLVKRPAGGGGEGEKELFLGAFADSQGLAGVIDIGIRRIMCIALCEERRIYFPFFQKFDKNRLVTLAVPAK